MFTMFDVLCTTKRLMGMSLVLQVFGHKPICIKVFHMLKFLPKYGTWKSHVITKVSRILPLGPLLSDNFMAIHFYNC